MISLLPGADHRGSRPRVTNTPGKHLASASLRPSAAQTLLHHTLPRPTESSSTITIFPLLSLTARKADNKPASVPHNNYPAYYYSLTPPNRWRRRSSEACVLYSAYTRRRGKSHTNDEVSDRMLNRSKPASCSMPAVTQQSPILPVLA